MDLDAYLRRLDFSAPVKPDFETLRAVHRAHMLAVPFENLDIVPLHRRIHLDEASMWDKLIVRRRGGFCYELNGLFAWLLKQVGFAVTYLNGRVFSKTGTLSLDFDHLALLVDVPGEPNRWLADVGFGDSFLEPLMLREGEQPEGLRSYRLEATGNGYIVWQRDYDRTWTRQYFFDLTPRRFPADYDAMCTYHQTSPKSSFTRKSIISRATPDGRVSLEPSKLIVTRNGERSEQPVSPDSWSALLLEHFGVVL